MTASISSLSADGVESYGVVDDGLSVFVSVRSRLFGIAYRILKTTAEAEDVVQDVWLRWQCTDRSVICNPAAFLATTATRLCLNIAQSARCRRETYVGRSIPESVDPSADPELGAERREALNLALVLLLERLSPKERAAYVLREAFDYAYRQIAECLQTEEANARQLVSRARKHVADGHRVPVRKSEQRRLVVAFIDAAHRADFAALKGLFTCNGQTLSQNGGVFDLSE
jgi:RNA polymerase sigma factor (sigma-70 family)